MDIRRQRCQACRSLDVRNILVREAGQPTTVYVKCVSCDELVARYKLSEYYHHGKDIESFLRSRGPAAAESGRDLLGEFEQVKSDALDGYQRVLDRLRELDKPV